MGDKAHTTQTLRQTLFETIEGVIEGTVTEKAAAQVANLADKIVKTADLEMRYTEHVLKADKAEMAPGPMLLGQIKAPEEKDR